MAATNRRPARFLPASFLLLLIIFYLCLSQTPNSATDIPRTKLYQYNPLSWQTRVENYDHHVLPAELACQNGTLPRPSSSAPSPGPTPVPRIVHFTWGLQGDGAFTFALYLAVRAAQASIQPTSIRIHYTRLDRSNPWFRRLEPSLTLVYHAPESYLGGAAAVAQDWHVAHVADVLRLQVLRDEGGIYLDADAYALGKGWDGVLAGARDVVLGHEGGNRYGMANAVIVAKKSARFVERWLRAYESDFDESDWNAHSVVLPKRLSERFPDEVCGLSPRAFFWPLWTERHVEWMHERLGEEEARRVEEQVRRNNGALYEDQLVYHAWSHNSFEKYVERLTPEIIETEDTRFNILMRRFLPDR